MSEFLVPKLSDEERAQDEPEAVEVPGRSWQDKLEAHEALVESLRERASRIEVPATHKERKVEFRT